MALGFSVPGGSATQTGANTMTNEQGCVRQRGGPQDPGTSPPPVMEACLGPYKLQIPANYFDDQMGPNFDGSFGLYLEYPELNAFAPGERAHLKLDVATRTVNIGYRYLDRVDPDAFLRRQYTPDGATQDTPEADINTRIKGEEKDGLTPYYANVAAYREHYRAQGLKPSNSIMEASYYKDWYVSRDAKGNIDTIIKCTSRAVEPSGVEFREGKLVRSKERELPSCEHVFVIPEMKVAVEIDYVRVALKDWKKIQDRARSALKTSCRRPPAPERLPATRR
ncbi:hypothetical protein [Xanthomonas campestris]|jgi:hypothetical protein|uniref:hypothetical protein n=2 Tax=Xanthomonas campestris TaxID=339 RepID=UPI001CDD6456|nr:hypothetical protein [Xanthomonas campestris]MCC5053377.1 hypothetical protein [Xanthomonas campestris pv. aberrans]MDM7672433.1 hypothetical protein [Xanthomonas campestris pv. campestris]MDM7676749.1 hypothetical protein [Xanthomonas campestris pv. campestris]MDM7680946.1 hypothetical protein [Xanthomonas campestris pv. campestris]MDM7684616.1 hypothetical protein [Xanthomonas campestris pv. campestris]